MNGLVKDEINEEFGLYMKEELFTAKDRINAAAKKITGYYDEIHITISDIPNGTVMEILDHIEVHLSAGTSTA